MKFKKMQIFFTIVVSCFIISDLILAQKGTSGRGKGRINGIVTDKEGNPILNAQIEMIYHDDITNFITKTNKKGKWSIVGLGTGNFRIIVKADGYIPVNIIREVSQLIKNAPINIEMEKSEKTVIQEDLMQFLKEGNRLFKEKKYDESIAAFQKVIEKAPDVYQISYKIGDCYREKGDLDKAIEIYEEVIKKAEEKKDISNIAKALGTIGGIYLGKQELEKAQSYFKKSIEINPKDEILAYNVGEINLNSNNIDAAITYFKMSSKIKPTWNVPYLKLGYAYLNKGDFATAIEMFNKVVELDPDSQEAITAKEIIKSLPK